MEIDSLVGVHEIQHALVRTADKEGDYIEDQPASHDIVHAQFKLEIG